MSIASTVVTKAPRILQRFAPGAVRVAAEGIQGMTGMVDRLAAYGDDAARLAGQLRLARDAGMKVSGTAMAITKPAVETLTREESSGLARVLLGQIASPEEASRLLTPRTVHLIQRGMEVAQRSGRPFAGELRASRALLSPRAMQNGAALYQKALQDEAEGITQRIVKERIAPEILTLTDPAAKDFGMKTANAMLEGSGGNGMLQGLRAFNTATLLGRAVILNATQTGLAGMVAGTKPFFQAMRDISTQAGRARVTDLSLRLGSSLDTALTDYLRHDMGQGRIARFSSEMLRRTGFSMIERLNRRFSTAVADHWFTDLIRNAGVSDVARMHLARFGVKPGMGTELARERFITNFVRHTQFRMTPEELPAALSAPGWGGEIAKTVFQFKPFALKATEMMIRELQTQGRWGFLGRTLGFGTAMGVPAAELRRATGGSRREKGIPRRWVEGLFAMGIGGMFADLVMAAEGNPGKIMEFVTGPSLGLAAEVGSGAYRLAQGRPKPLARTIVRRTPVIGPAAAGLLPGRGGRERNRDSILPD